jgi:DNA-binding NarL/FixJ family response regulator
MMQNTVNAVVTNFHQLGEQISLSGDYRLTPREQDVLALLACGLQNKEIAKVLTISPNTVAGYIKDIYRKLAVNNRASATFKAMELGLIKTASHETTHELKTA